MKSATMQEIHPWAPFFEKKHYASKQGDLTSAVGLCVCDVAGRVDVAQSSENCAHAASLRVRCFRAFHLVPFPFL